MPSSQVTKTPNIIQQAWNDGLYSLREKRNGVARGTSIEEKAMYVLGLGWKFRGNNEVKDNEIENTLYVSLQGLTQESKFLKIGQVLWEQCDESFILKMITSLSNNTPTQSRMFQQIALKERQNFKGYFSKANMQRISNNNLNAHDILNRESKQLDTNTQTSQKSRSVIDAEKKRLAKSLVSSKGINKRIVKFRPGSPETKRLAEELRVILRTYEANNIPEIAASLSIEIEEGFNKRFLTEEIIGVVCTYVEKELLIHSSGVSNVNSNVYIRQDAEGFETIRRLLKYTHFGLMVTEDGMSMDELKELDQKIARVRSTMESGSKKGKFNADKFDKELAKKDKFLNKVSGGGNYKPAGMKVKLGQAPHLYSFLRDKLSGDLSDGAFTLMLGSGIVLKDFDAVKYWISTNQYDVSLGSNIIGNEITNDSAKIGNLQFMAYSTEQLLEQLIMLQTSLDIDKTILSKISSENPLLGPSHPGLYLVAIIRKYLTLLREGTKFGFGKRNRGKQLVDVMDKFESNLDEATKEKNKNDKMFSKGPDGVFSPLSVDPKTLKDFYARMQPVYIVGGSVYSFNQGGVVSSGSDEITKESREKIDKQVRWNKVFAGKRGQKAAFEISSKGMNMMAYGTQEAPLTQEQGESNGTYVRRVIEAKMINEFKDKGLKINESIQPVFLVNKGINTSNVEVTALLNLIPSILNVIPGIGTTAGMAFSALMQSQIDAAKNLPKFARGGSFSTRNTNVSQFISGDSINNKINPERVTIDWATQRVNVQPLNNTVNNVTNLESGRITDPIMGTPTTIKVNDKSGKPTQAMSVVNAINPFDETLDSGGVNATPMQVLISLKESLVDILSTLSMSGQVEQTNAQMTAKVVDAISALNDTMSKNSNSSSTNVFGNIGKLARGE